MNAPTYYLGAYECDDGYNGKRTVVHVVVDANGDRLVATPTGYYTVPAACGPLPSHFERVPRPGPVLLTSVAGYYMRAPSSPYWSPR
jgi:hypothetical protein